MGIGFVVGVVLGLALVGAAALWIVARGRPAQDPPADPPPPSVAAEPEPRPNPDECVCADPGNRDGLHGRDLGTDTTNGRYGDVSLDRCERCGSYWLHYHVVYEGYSGSGRWFRGRLSEGMAAAVTAENAVGVLEGLDWYYQGGSRFGGTSRSSGPPMVDTI